MTVPLAPCYARVRDGGFVRIDGRLWRLVTRLGNGLVLLDPIRIWSAPAIGPNLYPTPTPPTAPVESRRVWTCHTHTRPMGIRQCITSITRQLIRDLAGYDR